MRRVRCLVVVTLVISFLALSPASSLAAEPSKILKLGTTVALKTKEGIQIKKWLDLFCGTAQQRGRVGGRRPTV